MNRGALPWVISGVAIVLALVVWMRSGGNQVVTNGNDAALAAKLQDLQEQLQMAQSDALMLRAELARFDAAAAARLQAAEATRANAKPSATPTPGGEAKQVDDNIQRLADSLARAQAGDKAAGLAGAGAMMDLLRAGPKALPAVLKAYHDAKDPKSKLALFPVIAFESGKDMPQFVKDELPNATDPQLRDTLLRSAASNIASAADPAIKQTFIDTLSSDSTADAGGKAAAINGLRFDFSPDTNNLLLSQAGSSDEQVRLAAIKVLSGRPDLRDKLQGLLTNDPSAQVRQIGQCEILLSQHTPF